MPTYDYQCRSCGNTTEVIHPMSEEGPTTCEVCGGPLRRVLYPAGIIFKGSGFYKTDSRGSSTSASPSGRNGGTPSTDAPSATTPPAGDKTGAAADSGAKSTDAPKPAKGTSDSKSS